MRAARVRVVGHTRVSDVSWRPHASALRALPSVASRAPPPAGRPAQFHGRSWRCGMVARRASRRVVTARDVEVFKLLAVGRHASDGCCTHLPAAARRRTERWLVGGGRAPVAHHWWREGGGGSCGGGRWRGRQRQGCCLLACAWTGTLGRSTHVLKSVRFPS